jgi:nucleoside-diphosphate-sugar epimerase
MKILVTGANGFIGSHLCKHLLAKDHEVLAVVRTKGSAPPATTELVIPDIGPTTSWLGSFSDIDAVVHLAARVHVMNDTSADPEAEFRRINAAGTATLAREAANSGVRRFVYLSTIKVNGERTDGTPFSATDAPRPQDPYGLSKHEGELELRRLEEESAMELVIVRTPLVYGPGVGGNFVRTLNLVERSIPLPLASVRNHRTMASVWNLVDLLEKGVTEEAAAGALILAGDEHSPSTAELFREMAQAMGQRSRLFPFPIWVLRLAGRVTGKSAVLDRLTGSLEVAQGSSSNGWRWSPPFTFGESIERTARWYMNRERPELRQ